MTLYDIAFSMTHTIPAGGGASRHPNSGDLDQPIDGFYAYVDPAGGTVPVYIGIDKDADPLGNSIKVFPGDWRSIGIRVRKFMSFLATDAASINHVGWVECQVAY